MLGEPAGSPALRPRVGYVTQAPSVYGGSEVRENLRYFAGVLGVAPARVEEVHRQRLARRRYAERTIADALGR